MTENVDITPEEEARALLDEEIQNAWHGLLKQEAGRLILWSIMDKCGCFNFDHYGGEVDIINRGRQQIGGELLTEFVFPHGMKFYTDMMLEADIREDRLRLASSLTKTQDEQEE